MSNGSASWNSEASVTRRFQVVAKNPFTWNIRISEHASGKSDDSKISANAEILQGPWNFYSI